MSFMQPVIEAGFWARYDSDDGSVVSIPEEYFDANDLSADETDSLEIVKGFGARLSASGYLDCTEWAVYDTEAEAAQSLLDMHYDQAYEDMSEDELYECRELEALTK